MNYLGNFDISESKDVIDETIFKHSYENITLDLRMRLLLKLFKSEKQELEIKTELQKNNTSNDERELTI